MEQRVITAFRLCKRKRIFIQMIDLRENGKSPPGGAHMGDNGQRRLPPMCMDPKGPNEDAAGVQSPMCVHAVASGSVPISPIDDTVQGTILNHPPRNPNASTEDHKGIRKEHVDSLRLIPVDFLVAKLSMDPQQRCEMMQVRIVINIVRMTVMRKRMLMLPQNGVAE